MIEYEDNHGQFKREEESSSSWLGSYNKFNILASHVIQVGILDSEKSLREVIVKIGLEIIDTQEGITVEAFLDNRAIRLVMNSKFAKKQEFKLKKIKKHFIKNIKKEWR